MPDIKAEQGEHILTLWQGAWIAALITGVITWALIIGVPLWFRRRRDDEVPVQTRYNLPIEIFYTIFPVIMVIAFFSQTVRVQNVALEMDPEPDVVVTVVGQKWSWTFNYPDTEAAGGKNVFTSGDGDEFPQLVIPVDQTVEFQLYSPDVIHNFGIPAFAMRMDVIPGNDNAFQVKPTETGTYDGKCYELCGAYHSRMLFTVKVVTEAEYQDYLAGLAQNPDNVSEAPVLGGEYSRNLINPDEEESE
ncbi:cytochrome c oxidase subunit II [Nocardioides sp. zg-536]|uniref:cytochrome-c oxidase n=2 Tax=Nocardioides faecalis TaxID=2803858 RepID=A0A939BX64_9ACTN|nr:cytochrome c oxidase subunit II [Nocardioides faecalis]MBM9461382.1 cytochrome c oxidase subunit II [Nocardioides faecalis]MBS4752346.1 cytochrome c oxidase subunit II [Nocardioides faecalis]QVI57647.1 cytochrome c oxidase subunit II [Nocardioides faecalis]